LTSFKAGEERLRTDALNLTQQDFAAEGYQPEDEEEVLNLAFALIPDILKKSRESP
jgi:hypothetical protein